MELWCNGGIYRSRGDVEGGISMADDMVEYCFGFENQGVPQKLPRHVAFLI